MQFPRSPEEDPRSSQVRPVICSQSRPGRNTRRCRVPGDLDTRHRLFGSSYLGVMSLHGTASYKMLGCRTSCTPRRKTLDYERNDRARRHPGKRLGACLHRSCSSCSSCSWAQTKSSRELSTPGAGLTAGEVPCLGHNRRATTRIAKEAREREAEGALAECRLGQLGQLSAVRPESATASHSISQLPARLTTPFHAFEARTVWPAIACGDMPCGQDGSL